MNHIPNFGRAWRRTFWATYDHLGLMVLLSLIWLICAITIFLVPAVTFALYHIAHLIVQDREVKIKDFFYILPRYFIRSTSLVLTFVAAFLLLLLNMAFYSTHLGTIGILLAGISFWLLILLCLMGIYVFPLLTIGKGYKETIRYSLLLVLNNLMFTLKFAFFTVILLAVEIILPIIGIGILAIFSEEAFLELQALYNKDIKPTEPRRGLKELLRPWDFS